MCSYGADPWWPARQEEIQLLLHANALFVPLSTNTVQTPKSGHLENLVAAFPFQGFGQDYRYIELGTSRLCYNVFLICDFTEDF